MAATLISAIGRGRKDAGQAAYQRTSYRIGSYDSPPTPFFVEAWLTSPEGAAIDRVELIGTATSSWSALAEEVDAPDLWQALELRCERQDSPGASEADLVPLAELLQQRWHRHVRCHVLCHREIDDASADVLVERLLALLPIDDPQRNLVLDSTHGFRTLPLLSVAALQVADGLVPGLFARTRLIYGEYLGSGSRGFAFDSIQRLAAVSRACAVFLDTLDPEPLAEAVRQASPRLADALHRFGLALGANAFDRLDERRREVRNSLDDLGLIRLAWRGPLCQAVEAVIAPLDQPTLPRRLLALARLRAQRGHYGPAILALAEAATALHTPQPVAEFDELKAEGRRFVETLPDRGDRQAWHELFALRNRIAHGANLVIKDGALTEQTLERRYDHAYRLVARLISKP